MAVLTEIGTFPASGLNLGLAAAPLGFTAEITKLQADISQLGIALEAQAQVTASFPPNLIGLAAAFSGALDASALAAALNPTTWVSVNADGNATLVLELGAIDALLAIVGDLVADLELGLSAGGLAGWSYAGRTAGYGTTLERATASGFGTFAPDTQISALVIACAGFSSWGGFSAGFNTGTSSLEDLGTFTREERLRFLGALGGGDWNTGVREVFAHIHLFLAELRTLRAVVAAQIDLSLGLNLPDASVVVDAGLSIDLDAAFENLVDVQLDIEAAISGLQFKIDALLELIGSINLSLSGGGLTLWSYSGLARLLGSSLVPAVAAGLPGTATGPNAPAYGIVIAAASPSAWASFGRIFKTS